MQVAVIFVGIVGTASVNEGSPFASQINQLSVLTSDSRCGSMLPARCYSVVQIFESHVLAKSFHDAQVVSGIVNYLR